MQRSSGTMHIWELWMWQKPLYWQPLRETMWIMQWVICKWNENTVTVYHHTKPHQHYVTNHIIHYTATYLSLVETPIMYYCSSWFLRTNTTCYLVSTEQHIQCTTLPRHWKMCIYTIVYLKLMTTRLKQPNLHWLQQFLHGNQKKVSQLYNCATFVDSNYWVL